MKALFYRCIGVLFTVLFVAWWPLAYSAQPTEQVSLVFAGDIVLDDTAGTMIERGEDPFSGLAAVFAGADIRIGNLECVVASIGSAGNKNFTFRAHPRTLPVLKRHFDAVALANNHSGDYGREAFAQMLDLLKEADLAQFGGGHNLSQAHTPLIIERKGLRIALLSYSEFMPRSFEADYNAPGIAWSEDEQVAGDIRKARAVHGANLVIPVMHWGWENEPTSNARQRQLARLMIDAGADAVMGGHPHVTQETAQYQGQPIIYSVGNFVMKETDAQGVSRFDTVPVQIDMEGIPQRQRNAASPCWQRGDTDARLCMPD
jgi:poly-gamma-glutamate synthesis protein (capsule biosynthesis protein)